MNGCRVCHTLSLLTWPGVSSVARASVCSSQAAGAPERGSPSPWPLGCPVLDRDGHEDSEWKGSKLSSLMANVCNDFTTLASIFGVVKA